MLYEHDWWISNYAADIIEVLRQREISYHKYTERLPQLSSRRKLVDWLITVGKDLELRKTGVYLSVYLLDHFMDGHDLCECHLTFVAACCLLIAAKFEDNKSCTPQISKLNQMIPQYNYTRKEFIRMELTILKFFDWCITIPTVPHFIDYFATEALTYHDLSNCTLNSLSNKKMMKYIDYFMQLSLQDLTYSRFPPSLIAASCIASTRLYLMLSPNWTAKLETITGYSWVQLQSCVEIMMSDLEFDDQLAHPNKAQRLSNHNRQ